MLFDEDHFEVSPIFDKGISLLTANQSVNWNFSMEENVRRVTARPFSGSHEKMYEYFGRSFVLDIKKVLDWLDEEPDTKEKSVLAYQIQKYHEKGMI